MNATEGQNRHHRRSIRLGGYDYRSPAAYFVTVCTHQRLSLFGDVLEGAMRTSDAGLTVQRCWENLPRHYPHVALDAFVVMPNHVHGVIILTDDPPPDRRGGFQTRPYDGSCADDHSCADRDRPTAPAGGGRGAIRHAVSEVIRAFKTFSARQINAARATPGVPVWQRNYWEHIVRDSRDLDRVRRYIDQNVSRWQFDPEHPSNAAESANGWGRVSSPPLTAPNP